MLLWLKRLFASKKRLVGGPDFNRAPWRTLDISGTVVRFKNPPKSSGLANRHWPEKVDLYKEDYEEWHEGDGLSKHIFKNFWSFYDHLIWGEGVAGVCDLYISIQRRAPHNWSIQSMLDPKDCQAWILAQCKKTAEKFDFKVPLTVDDLDRVCVNHHYFYRERIYRGQRGWYEEYHTPLSDDHLLSFYFRPGCDQGLMNDEHNVEAEVEKTIQSFMENLHITLSPDTQKRIEVLKRNESV
ncbi:hypothetical protein [Endozoicomonas numazuensis]|uniref:Uncharacterized protein n=1 Tax=Endozoicomonas numazuensis TaxID=1137799 RepID=A0A081NHR5_9GAMM|nr:hypothetical protein [Endozoicomonas numazuensis]KEQ17988.1 hypothetical protein GZ78_10290 [Endozoicomonas numazuensis]